MNLKLSQMVFSKFDFRIKGIIINISDEFNDDIETEYKIKNIKDNKIYKFNKFQLTDDPCEIIDLLCEQVDELRNNYYDLKLHSMK